jgi:hypothetical protein
VIKNKELFTSQEMDKGGVITKIEDRTDSRNCEEAKTKEVPSIQRKLANMTPLNLKPDSLIKDSSISIKQD